MDVLTPLQRRVILDIGRSPLADDFFLTGGTALAACYLQHRYSVDLDFFTANPAGVVQVPAVMQEIADLAGLEIAFTRTFRTFLQCFVRDESGERLQLDFAQDSPYRIEPTRFDSGLGFTVDSAIDIACNKLSALFDRAEPKDFVDVYFVVHELVPFERLVALARQKHVGLDDYWLAIALAQIERVEVLPRMIKAVSLDELRAFFQSRAKELMDRLEGGEERG